MRAHAIVALVGLALVPTACLPPATIRFVEQSTPPPVFTEGSVAKTAEAPKSEWSSAIRPGECPAEIGDSPAPYFGGRVLLRLPGGVTEDNFVEFMPSFARSTEAIESINCQEDLPGATIYYMALTSVAEHPGPGKSLEDIRDELLAAFGYPPGIELVELDLQAVDRPMWVYEVPGDPSAGKPEPAKILLAMQVAHGQTHVIVYEVHPNAWSAMVDTLVASAQSMTIVPP